MNKLVVIRLLFAGSFALISLTGAVTATLFGLDTPSWLVAIVATSAGYIFGHVQANGNHKQQGGNNA